MHWKLFSKFTYYYNLYILCHVPWILLQYLHLWPKFFKQSDLTEENYSRMPENELSLMVYLMGRCHSKVISQKRIFFYKYLKQLLVKRLLVKELLLILHRLQIKQIIVEDYIFKKISMFSSYQSQLKAYYISLHPKTSETCWSPDWLKKYMPNCTPSFFSVP